MNTFGRWGRALLIGFPFGWLAVFFLLPLAIVVGISFTESADAVPPYAPLWTRTATGIESHATLANYAALCQGCVRAYGESLGYAALATLLCLRWTASCARRRGSN